MNEQEILSNISARLGITALKPMQIELAASDSSKIRLAAPTGSGKTIAFVINLLKHIAAPGKGVQALIIAPSRELALQINSVVKGAAVGYKVVALYGGHKMEDEKNSLSPLPDIVVATPGRLLDHLNRGTISLSDTKSLVLDEYDKCVELGFEADMKKIVRKMPSLKQIVLTSATIASQLPDYLTQVGWQEIDYSKGTSLNLQKVHVESPAADKAQTLVDLLCAIPQKKIMTFVNHRESAERLYNYLKKSHIPAVLYHGGLEQHDRQMAVNLFENGTVDIIVATDLAARGLDIEGVDAVIHYHLPPTAENWVHRNGRTARNGADGTVYVITSEADSIPDYVEWDRDYFPPAVEKCDLNSDIATLHFNVGRKEKVSKGDIVGFLIANAALDSVEIGKINVWDHEAIAAVPAGKIRAIVKDVEGQKLKNKKVRVTQLRP
ncbi:MAG: DEAD/DEAH box helicase [Paramuribaculum sp.]|nr:DEAD/DEAH box helicase [Paramuribaculum sp.]